MICARRLSIGAEGGCPAAARLSGSCEERNMRHCLTASSATGGTVSPAKCSPAQPSSADPALLPRTHAGTHARTHAHTHTRTCTHIHPPTHPPTYPPTHPPPHTQGVHAQLDRIGFNLHHAPWDIDTPAPLSSPRSPPEWDLRRGRPHEPPQQYIAGTLHICSGWDRCLPSPTPPILSAEDVLYCRD